MNKVPYVVIVALVVVIILMRSCNSSDVVGKETVYTKTDTIYKETHDTVTKKVNVTKVEYVPVDKLVFKSIDTCNKEYNKRTTYRDTIALDSLGTITVVDTVFQNSLGKRTILKDYKIPLVTKTVTITKEQEPKRQLYVGGNLFGDKRILQLISPGILYKDKKDRVYLASVGVNFDGTITYGIGAYFKIKIK